MGVVFLGLDRQGRAVAIKVLRPHIAYDPEARSRLEREVDILSRVDDPRVAAVIDADIFGDRPYIVTRYVPGPSLDEVVGERGPLSGEELLRLGRGLAGALDAIHGVGVIHRDLKPGNVLIEDGEPVVIDFGIAHIADDIRLTSVGLVMGTPGYLSPEVVEGGGVTMATDWWGWAATLAFAASGRPPFGRGPMDVVLDRVRHGRTDLTGVDPRLVPLLEAALSPDPQRRPPAVEVVAALQRYAVGAPATIGFTGVGGTGQADADPGWFSPLGADPTLRHTAAPATSTSALPQAEPQRPDDGGNAAGADESQWDESEWDKSQWDESDADERDADESDWPDGWDADPGQPDPRIGRPMRAGTLGALGAAFAGGAANWPGVTVLLVLLWCWVARFSDRSVTSLVLRRFERGRRRGDVPMAVLRSPWHLVTSAASTIMTLLFPAVVAVLATFGTVLGVSSLTSLAPGPATPIALVLGFAAGGVLAWWGPGGAALRRGSRSIVRGVIHPGITSKIVVGVLIAGALALVAMAFARQGALVWWPLSGDPGKALRSALG